MARCRPSERRFGLLAQSAYSECSLNATFCQSDLWDRSGRRPGRNPAGCSGDLVLWTSPEIVDTRMASIELSEGVPWVVNDLPPSSRSSMNSTITSVGGRTSPVQNRRTPSCILGSADCDTSDRPGGGARSDYRLRDDRRGRRFDTGSSLGSLCVGWSSPDGSPHNAPHTGARGRPVRAMPVLQIDSSPREPETPRAHTRRTTSRSRSRRRRVSPGMPARRGSSVRGASSSGGPPGRRQGTAIRRARNHAHGGSWWGNEGKGSGKNEFAGPRNHEEAEATRTATLPSPRGLVQ